MHWNERISFYLYIEPIGKNPNNILEKSMRYETFQQAKNAAMKVMGNRYIAIERHCEFHDGYHNEWSIDWGREGGRQKVWEN